VLHFWDEGDKQVALADPVALEELWKQLSSSLQNHRENRDEIQRPAKSGYYLRNPAVTSSDVEGVRNAVMGLGKLLAEATQDVIEFAPVRYFGSSEAKSVVVLFAGSGGGLDEVFEGIVQSREEKRRKTKAASKEREKKSEGQTAERSVGVMVVKFYRPWDVALFAAALPKSVKRVTVLDFIGAPRKEIGSFDSLLLDVSAAVGEEARVRAGKVVAKEGGDAWAISAEESEAIFDRLNQEENDKEGFADFVVETRNSSSDVNSTEVRLSAPVFDASSLRRSPYYDVLRQLFGGRLRVIESDPTTSAGTEFGYGVALSVLHQHAHGDQQQSTGASVWLVGGRDLQHEQGLAAVHHVLSSGENVNLLIVDDTPLAVLQGTEKGQPADNSGSRRKDLGLYAMNYGGEWGVTYISPMFLIDVFFNAGSYVASVALYSSYVQLIQALKEADAYSGPAVVLAYAPSVVRIPVIYDGVIHN